MYKISNSVQKFCKLIDTNRSRIHCKLSLKFLLQIEVLLQMYPTVVDLPYFSGEYSTLIICFLDKGYRGRTPNDRGMRIPYDTLEELRESHFKRLTAAARFNMLHSEVGPTTETNDSLSMEEVNAVYEFTSAIAGNRITMNVL